MLHICEVCECGSSLFLDILWLETPWDHLGRGFFPSNELIVELRKFRISWAPKLQFLGFFECFPKKGYCIVEKREFSNFSPLVMGYCRESPRNLYRKHMPFPIFSYAISITMAQVCRHRQFSSAPKSKKT